MHTVLIISHDCTTSHSLRAGLEAAGYRVLIASNTTAALRTLRDEQPPLLILDATLTDENGLDMLSRVRQEKSDVYILMIAARADDTERILALELGADDYVAYPDNASFNLREMVARVRSGFRRLRLDTSPQRRPSIMRYEGLCVDPVRRRVTLDGHSINLTPTEFNLLTTLMRNPGIVFSRADLIHQRHNTDYDSLERTLDSHIRNLRRKIEPDTAAPVYIQTVYGVGYRFGEQ